MITLLGLALERCSGYPSGAGSSACDSLVPGHGFGAQTGTSPYQMSLSASSYTSGGQIQGKKRQYKPYENSINCSHDVNIEIEFMDVYLQS